jgi:CBS domain-containing protein
MKDTPISNLIRVGRTLFPSDTIGRSAEALRSCGLTELPVVNLGRVVGVISEARVLQALEDGDAMTVADQPLSTILPPNPVCGNPFMTVGQVAEIMSDHNLQVLPVVDAYGSYLGALIRGDIVGMMRESMRPPSVAGMATPLGVYLTTGNLRAGAGDFGLMLTGVALMLMNLFSTGAVAWAVKSAQKFTHIPIWAAFNYSGFGHFTWLTLLGYALRGLSIVLFLLLFRLFPMSGYHAAEHETVHAIEAGEPLTASNVAAMPRVHPRCGTNIVAGLMLFMVVTEAFSSDIAVIVTLFLLVFAWRSIGGFFQYFITTKNPSADQIENGIRAGQSLLDQYRKDPGHRVTGWQRMWNTGMPQVMLGVIFIMLIQEYLLKGLRIPGL